MKTIIDEHVFTHPVKMPLTEKEIIAYADELAAVDEKQTAATLRHDSEKNAFKSEMKLLAQQQNRLLNLIKTKEEFKQIECYHEFDYFEGVVEVKRCDNDQTVTTRKMTSEEFQQNLPLAEGEKPDDE